MKATGARDNGGEKHKGYRQPIHAQFDTEWGFPAAKSVKETALAGDCHPEAQRHQHLHRDAQPAEKASPGEIEEQAE